MVKPKELRIACVISTVACSVAVASGAVTVTSFRSVEGASDARVCTSTNRFAVNALKLISSDRTCAKKIVVKNY